MRSRTLLRTCCRGWNVEEYVGVLVGIISFLALLPAPPRFLPRRYSLLFLLLFINMHCFVTISYRHCSREASHARVV